MDHNWRYYDRRVDVIREVLEVLEDLTIASKSGKETPLSLLGGI